MIPLTEVNLAEILKRVPNRVHLIPVGDGSEGDRAYFRQFLKLVRLQLQNLEGRVTIDMDQKIRSPETMTILLGLNQVAESLRAELRAITLQSIAA